MDVTEAWLVPKTWVVYGIYLFMPLGLFWLMDRMGALSDTSFFSALLIGLAYPAILAGGFGGLKVPTSVGDLAKPIVAFTDTMIDSINKAIARRDKRFEDLIVKRMIAKKELFDQLLGKVRLSGIKIDDLEAQLKQADANSALDQLQKTEKKARAIYLYLSSIPEAVADLKRDSAATGQRIRPAVKTGLVFGLFAACFVGGVVGAAHYLSRPDVSMWVGVWRIGKPNSTDLDRERARRYLASCVATTNLGPATCHSLITLLHRPGLTAQRVDICLQLLLRTRDQPYHQEMICSELIDALRVDSADARSHIQQALVLLATHQEAKFKDTHAELCSWNPTTDGSIITVEPWIDRWRDYFCHTKPVTPHRSEKI